MYMLYYFLTALLFTQNSLQKDISLHYPSRIGRSEDDEDSNTTLNVLAQIVSLLVFVFYIFIIFGLIKACLGLCCSPPIGDLGLDLLTENPPEEYHRNTVFCLNIVFFLVLPFVLFRSFCYPRTCDDDRLCAGGDKDVKKTQSTSSEPKKVKIKTEKKKKRKLDIYRDGNDSENQDTKYVLEQLHRSEQTMRSGVFGYSTLLEERKE